MYVVTITHLPSGIVTRGNERSIHLSKRVAMQMMRSKLAAPASPFMQREYVLDEPPDGRKQIIEFDNKYGTVVPGPVRLR